jgi:photosystem II stability/assembly factor-like uncharacterized protein
MEELMDAAALSPRGRRALVLIAIALVGLTAAGVLYMWPTLTARNSTVPLILPGKGSLNSIRFFDQEHGWAVLAGPLPSSAPSSILRTSDGGRHWSLADVPGAASYSVTRFFDPRRALVSVNTPIGQILYSTDDGGLSWKSFDLPGRRNDGFFSLVFLDPLRGWYLERTPASPGTPAKADEPRAVLLWRTQDGGATWSEVLAVEPSHPSDAGLSVPGFKAALSFNDDRHGSLLSTPSQTFYLTADGGLSWQPKPLPLFPFALVGDDGRGSIVHLFNFPDLLVEMVSVAVPGSTTPTFAIYSRVSEDRGSTWSALRPLPTNPSAAEIPQVRDSRHWVIATGRKIWQTSDAGNKWEVREAKLPGSLAISDLQLVGAGVIWAVAPNRGAPDRLLRSRDGGAHWEDQGAPSLQLVR